MLRWVMVTFAVLGGCNSKSGTVELSTPDAAARCQVAAIRAKDLGRWTTCWHPRLRAELETKLSAKTAEPGTWDKLAKKAAPLEHVKAADFTLAPIPPDMKEWGDQRASYRMPDDSDSFELVRENGRWFVVDSGI